MKEQFQTFAQLCTRSLADDPALRLEVEQELEGHLEDACEEEQSEGKSESEAEDQAKKRFGEPEELAQSLLDANRRKLKLRARIRLAAKIALIPVILIGLALCIDLRTLTGISLLISPGRSLASPNTWQEKLFLANITHDINRLHEKDQKSIRNFLQPWTPGKKSLWQKERYETNPDSRAYTAAYALSQFSSEVHWTDEERANYLRLLEHGRRIDPDNALYDYLEANLVTITALNMEKKKQVWHYTVEDRAALDRGMKLYLAALEKPFVNTYSMEMPAEVRRLLNPRKDFFGLLERINIYANTPLPFVAQMRAINRKSMVYGEILLKEGKTAEAEKYLHSWRKFIPQQQKYNSNTLIEVLVCYGCIGVYLDSAQKRGDTVEAEKLNRISAILRDWKAQKSSNNHNILKHGGILSGIYLPALKEEIPVREFEPERKLSYLVGDLGSLALLSLFLTTLIIIFGIGLLMSRVAGHRPFLLFLPLKSYRKILIFGILIPIGIFLLYTHIDLLGGRDLSVQMNLLRWFLGVVGIVFVFPLFFEHIFLRELKKQGKRLGFRNGKLPFATNCLNRVFAFAVLLLVTGCILRPLLVWECRRYIARDGLFGTDTGYSQVELRVANQLNSKLADAIAAADRTP